MPNLKSIFNAMKVKKKKKSNTIEQLLETTEVLEKKSSFLEKKIEDEEYAAKTLGTGNQRRKLPV